ncbi:tetratricopeptide repeat protein [Modicisalibacter luteus]
MAQLRQDTPPASAERYLEALIAAHQERTDEALASLDALARELPDLSLIPATAAEIALDAGRRDVALSRAERILRLSPSYFPARLLRAEILLQQSPGDAFNALRQLSQQYPETPQVFALLAEAAGRSGHETWGHLARAETLQLTGHIDRAIKQLDVAEDVAKRNGDFNMASRIRQRREDYMDYRETLQKF